VSFKCAAYQLAPCQQHSWPKPSELGLKVVALLDMSAAWLKGRGHGDAPAPLVLSTARERLAGCNHGSALEASAR
jgi:hypothetical protein